MITLLKRLKIGLSRRISLLSTIRLDVWLHYKRRVWLHRRANFIARGATIRVEQGGLFQIGMPQSGELFYASEFYMLPGAVCTVQNNFRLSSGTRLRMNCNAHLSVGSCFVNHGGMIDCTGSIVTKDVPPRCLVAGIPARMIRENVVWGEPDWDQVATEAARYNNAN